MAKAVIANLAAELLTARTIVRKFFLILRRLLSRVFFFPLNFRGASLERSLGLLQFFLARIGGNHDVQDFVFQLADFRLGLLDLAEQRLVLLVGLDGERLVAIFADLLLLVLDVGLVLAAGTLVRLHRRLDGLDASFRRRELGLDLSHLGGKRSHLRLQCGNADIDLLQVYQLLYVRMHGTRWNLLGF